MNLSFSLRMQIASCEFVLGGDYKEVINGGYVERLICGGEMRDTPTHDLSSNNDKARAQVTCGIRLMVCMFLHLHS